MIYHQAFFSGCLHIGEYGFVLMMKMQNGTLEYRLARTKAAFGILLRPTCLTILDI